LLKEIALLDKPAVAPERNPFMLLLLPYQGKCVRFQEQYYAYETSQRITD
jgi:hypothetical protein